MVARNEGLDDIAKPAYGVGTRNLNIDVADASPPPNAAPTATPPAMSGTDEQVIPGSAADILIKNMQEARAEAERLAQAQIDAQKRDQEARDQETAELQRQAAHGKPVTQTPPAGTSGQTADASGQVGAAAPDAASSPAAPATETVTPAVHHTKDGHVVLRRGMGLDEAPEVQDAVKQWQQELKTKGLYEGPIDGIFGKGTDEATHKYQQNYTPDKVDGIVGAQTWASYEAYKGQPYSEVPSRPLPPPPGVAQAPDDAPLTATQIVHGTPEQREASMKQLQAEIDAKFDKENHTRDANGTHHYSMSWVGSIFSGTPQVPEALTTLLKQGNDPRVNITDDTGAVIKVVSIFNEDGSLNPEAKKSMLEGAFNGKLEAAGKKAEEILEAQAQAGVTQPSAAAQPAATGPRPLVPADVDINRVAAGHEADRDALMIKIGTQVRKDNPDPAVEIEITPEMRAQIDKTGVYNYGNGQSIDFRVDPNSPLDQQVAKLKAEMHEFAGLISGGKDAQFNDAGVQAAAGFLAKPAGQTR